MAASRERELETLTIPVAVKGDEDGNTLGRRASRKASPYVLRGPSGYYHGSANRGAT